MGFHVRDETGPWAGPSREPTFPPLLLSPLPRCLGTQRCIGLPPPGLPLSLEKQKVYFWTTRTRTISCPTHHNPPSSFPIPSCPVLSSASPLQQAAHPRRCSSSRVSGSSSSSGMRIRTAGVVSSCLRSSSSAFEGSALVPAPIEQRRRGRSSAGARGLAAAVSDVFPR